MVNGVIYLVKSCVKLRAIYADTDAMGIVYHTNYIRWFEIGRTELFRSMGIVSKNIEPTGVNLPITKVYCHYLRSARYDDLVQIETEVDYLKRASIRFSYKVWDESLDNLLTEGYTVHACTDRDGKIIRVPTMIAEKIWLFSKISKER